MTILLMVILGATFGVLSAMFDWPTWSFFLFIIAATILLLSNLFYTAYRTKNLYKIRKFIERHKKDPVYKFMLQHADNAPAQDKIDTLEQVLTKYKQDKFQATYGVHLALVKDDLEAAKQAIKPILDSEIGAYTNDIIYILNGEQPSVKRQYSKQWMNDSILAHEAFMRGDLQAFDNAVQKSLANTGGVQLFGNYYSFQQMREKFTS